LKASTLSNYSLPIFAGISDEYIVHDRNLPLFVTFNSPQYQFLPEKPNDLGISIISG